MRAPHSSHALQPVSSQVLVQSFVTPPGKVYLLYGDNLVFQLSLRMAASAMAQGKPIAVVDGCNQFNVHLLSRFARERHLNPEQFLNLIFISRGFTCYQMEQAIASRLPVFLEDIHSNTAMIFGLLDTFYDEQAPFREVQQILKRLLLVLQNMKADGISVLLTCTQWNVLPRERNQLFATLRSGMDRVYRLELSEAHGPQLFLESTVEDAVPLMLTARAGSAIHPTQTCREKGDDLYGTNGSDVYQHYRQRDRKLVKVPPGTAPGGPGNLR